MYLLIETNRLVKRTKLCDIPVKRCHFVPLLSHLVPPKPLSVYMSQTKLIDKVYADKPKILGDRKSNIGSDICNIDCDTCKSVMGNIASLATEVCTRQKMGTHRTHAVNGELEEQDQFPFVTLLIMLLSQYVLSFVEFYENL